MSRLKTGIKGLRRLTFLMFVFLASVTSGYGEVNTSEFEEAFQIERYSQKWDAPDFTLSDLEQRQIKLKDHKNKYILLNFWATWCLPCIRELPELEKLRQALPESEFQIIAVNVRDRESRLRKFLATRQYGFAIPLDRTGEIYKVYGVAGFPTTFLIDRQGQLYGRISGIRSWMEEGFVEYMKNLIKGE